jgi:H+-transporting ATPase
VALIIVAGILRLESIFKLIQFTLILSIASIPIAQPAVLSVTMAVGATVLAKKDAIVSKLSAIVEMASMNILCADKTGTITENIITVADIDPTKPFQNEDVLLYSSLASQEEDHDPIDLAIIQRTREMGIKFDDENIYKRLKFIPFDPVAKRTESIIDNAKQQLRVTKGAPQVILELSSNKDEIRTEIEEKVIDYALRGFRSLGVAKTDQNDELRFVGLIALHDPPKKDSASTIAKAAAMGTEVKMVTGDHIAIAKETARQVEMGDNILTADALANKPHEEALKIVEDANGFAQVFPEDKFEIVELLQEDGEVVGMTGDGVNDAPALKKADAGIAVSEATDAAKSAADIVLTESGLAVVITAIKESRKIFQRMKSYSIYRVTETMRILIFTALAILIFNFYPVSAIMLVLLALLDDIPIMTIAYDRTAAPKEPKKWDMNIVLGMSTLLGLIGVVTSFMLLYVGKQWLLLSVGVIQSFIFLKLVVAGHLTMFATRLEKPWWSKAPSWILFSAVIGTDIAATLVVIFGWLVTPIGWGLAALVWAFAIVGFLVEDFIKVRFYRWYYKRAATTPLEKRLEKKGIISGIIARFNSK